MEEKKIKVDKYTLDTLALSMMLLNWENEDKINSIRIYETKSYCIICIDKEKLNVSKN